MIPHRPGCDGHRHLHVIFQKADEKYRIALRCACGAAKRLGRYLYAKHAAAEDAIASIPIEKLFTQKRKRTAPPPARPTPVVVAPDIPIKEAWVLWWRGICARNGHESRLTANHLR